MSVAAAVSLKPDYEAACQRWLAFWAGELLDRPPCWITAPKAGAPPAPHPRYLSGAVGDMQAVADAALAWIQSVYWAGDSIPSYVPSFGPDQMAAFLGAELIVPDESENYGTDWVLPCIDDWQEALPIVLDPQNAWWTRLLEFYRILSATFDGQAALSHLDLHSNLDTLLAMRGGERLCMDLVLEEDAIDRAMADVRTLYEPIYTGVYEAGQMAGTGVTGWVPAYHPVRTNTIQCDFAALIGPAHFKRWALPALAEEAEYLGACIYHLDGPECLVHVDDLCSIPHLRGIQWTTGSRNKPFGEWMDLLHRIQAKGKALWVPCDTESIKYFHRELQHDQVFYVCHARDEASADATLEWLAANT
ncbi:MAG: hypothetical protein IT204_15000 [Fimbriimonadaceae bacterium]|nr:hypothetical protein [Fimbriimonadaceae bacterium]